MPIVINLDLMLVRRKMSLTELSQKVGVTMANLSILKQSKARAIRFSTLAAICRTLECRPGDILDYIESESDGDNVPGITKEIEGKADNSQDNQRQ
ncbi:MAG: helix-turn-helix transcriptional regulator [FCB group bacterium]|nr:helix-turn-helix transcriptional regulator [FCB group bacterium]